MKVLLTLFSSEIKHYQKLSKDGQRLLLSYGLYYIANPLLWTFSTAFLWRETNDIRVVTIYNIAIFMGLAFGFYFNGKLLQKFYATSLYRFGLLAQGIVFLALVFLPLHSFSSLPFGLMFGMTSGLFWSNKAFLTIHSTKSYMRVYFTGIEQIFNTITGIVVPLGIGWFIILGSNLHIFSSITAYRILGLVFLVVLYFAGMIVSEIRIEKSRFSKVTVSKGCKRWNNVRLTALSLGMSNGIESVVPLLMVLVLVGKEGMLGTIQSFSGVFLAFAIYQIAKKVQEHQRIYVLIAGVGLSIIASVCFSIYYSAFGVVLYFILNAFAGGFRWTTFNPMAFDTIVKEEKYHAKHRYRFIFDQQLWLNVGRNTGLVLFLLMYLHYGTEIALRFSPLIFALPQLCVFWTMGHVEKTNIKDDVEENQALLFHYAFKQQFYKD